MNHCSTIITPLIRGLEMNDASSRRQEFPIAYWIYKCNSRNGGHQRHFGDWAEFFRITETTKICRWGTTEIVPELEKLSVGDTIIAYQTDRNELVGVATVAEMRDCDPFVDVMLAPGESIGVKVRPLKKADAIIAKIAALQPGPIRTLYPITAKEAKHFLKVAREAARKKR